MAKVREGPAISRHITLGDWGAYLSAAEYLRQASFSTATSWTGASLVARGSGWPDSPRSS